MIRNSLTITLDNYSCVVADTDQFPQISQLANSYWCPLGVACGRAWLLMLRKDVEKIHASGAIYHELVFQDNENNTRIVFPKLLLIKSQRLGPGEANAKNALYLVELADKRFLLSQFSDTGNLQLNVRSYAQDDDYLSNTGNYTWSTAIEAIWNTMSVIMGSYPGLPTGYQPHGVPENLQYYGENAWQTLHEILSRINCTISYNPLTDLFSIVQLGTQQSDLPNSISNRLKQFDAEPFEKSNSKLPETIRVYFHNLYRSYGQERDTELDDNWIVSGIGEYVDVLSNVSDAIPGTILRLWDDLPRILSEDNILSNSTNLVNRAAERASNWLNERTISGEHRMQVFPGLISDVTPGSQVKVVLWRAWGPASGGTATEIITRPEMPQEITGGTALCDGILWSQLVSQVELTIDKKISPHSFPNYPRLPNIVQIYDTGSSPGETIDANGDGLHPGRVRRWVAGAMTILDDCWVRFVDDHDNNDGDVTAVNHDYHHGRLSGIETSGGSTKPIYLARRGGTGELEVQGDIGSIITVKDGETLHVKGDTTTDRSFEYDGTYLHFYSITDGGTDQVRGRLAKLIRIGQANGTIAAIGGVGGDEPGVGSVTTYKDDGTGKWATSTGTETGYNFHDESISAGDWVYLTMSMDDPDKWLVHKLDSLGETDFNITADSGTPENITTGETIDFEGTASGTFNSRAQAYWGIVTKVLAANKIQYAVDPTVCQGIVFSGTAKPSDETPGHSDVIEPKNFAGTFQGQPGNAFGMITSTSNGVKFRSANPDNGTFEIFISDLFSVAADAGSGNPSTLNYNDTLDIQGWSGLGLKTQVNKSGSTITVDIGIDDTATLWTARDDVATTAAMSYGDILDFSNGNGVSLTLSGKDLTAAIINHILVLAGDSGTGNLNYRSTATVSGNTAAVEYVDKFITATVSGQTVSLAMSKITRVGKANGSISALSGNTPGTGTASIWDDASDVTAGEWGDKVGTDVNVINFTDIAFSVGDYLHLTMSMDDPNKFFILPYVTSWIIRDDAATTASITANGGILDVSEGNGILAVLSGADLTISIDPNYTLFSIYDGSNTQPITLGNTITFNPTSSISWTVSPTDTVEVVIVDPIWKLAGDSGATDNINHAGTVTVEGHADVVEYTAAGKFLQSIITDDKVALKLANISRIGKVKAGGIAAVSGDTPGSGTVDVWVKGGGAAWVLGSEDETAYNFGTTALSENDWVGLTMLMDDPDLWKAVPVDFGGGSGGTHSVRADADTGAGMPYDLDDGDILDIQGWASQGIKTQVGKTGTVVTVDVGIDETQALWKFIGDAGPLTEIKFQNTLTFTGGLGIVTTSAAGTITHAVDGTVMRTLGYSAVNEGIVDANSPVNVVDGTDNQLEVEADTGIWLSEVTSGAVRIGARQYWAKANANSADGATVSANLGKTGLGSLITVQLQAKNNNIRSGEAFPVEYMDNGEWTSSWGADDPINTVKTVDGPVNDLRDGWIHFTDMVSKFPRGSTSLATATPSDSGGQDAVTIVDHTDHKHGVLKTTGTDPAIDVSSAAVGGCTTTVKSAVSGCENAPESGVLGHVGSPYDNKPVYTGIHFIKRTS